MHKLWLAYLAFWGFTKWYFIVSYVPFKYWRRRLLMRCSQPTEQAPGHPRAPHTNAEPGSLSISEIIHLSEKIARHHPLYSNCLRRCMVQYELLSRYGYSVQLHIGVRFSLEKKLQAHSWLICDGQLVNDAKEVVHTYTEIADISQFFAGEKVGILES